MRTVRQIPRANALGIWLPVSHAPSCIVTTNPSTTGLSPLTKPLGSPAIINFFHNYLNIVDKLLFYERNNSRSQYEEHVYSIYLFHDLTLNHDVMLSDAPTIRVVTTSIWLYSNNLGPISTTVFPYMWISIIEITRSWDLHILIMGILIVVRHHFYINGLWYLGKLQSSNALNIHIVIQSSNRLMPL